MNDAANAGALGAEKIYVSGRVQGVFFRESTRRQAQVLGLDGHAINLSDGRVEVLMSGPEEARQALRKWLQSGPPMARVDRLESEPHGDEVERGFRTG